MLVLITLNVATCKEQTRSMLTRREKSATVEPRVRKKGERQWETARMRPRRFAAALQTLEYAARNDVPIRRS